jgi:isoquinoline 1-oxidoreductase beta subunit
VPSFSLHGLRTGHDPSRRRFLIVMLETGAVLGYARLGVPAANVVAPDARPDSLTGVFEPTMWYRIGTDGSIVITIIRAEMGQHVGTALARIVADELEADWNAVSVDMVDSDPRWGEMITGGSWSVWQSFPILSRAGAAGRVALVEEGARLLGVSRQACTARDGAVHANGRSLAYGDIVRHGNLRRVFTPEQLQQLPIKTPAARRLVGRSTPALDVGGKVNGKARYGIDAAVAGMIFARPKIPPTRYGCRVISIDDSAARRVPGYIRSVALDDPSGTVPGWVMVYAETFAAADRAAGLVHVAWRPGDAVHVSERDVQSRAAALIASPSGGSLFVDDPGVDSAFASAARTIERTYTTGTVMHAQLEPVNGLAFEKNGVFEIHTGNQWQTLILPTLATALGRSQHTIVLRTYLIGGAFGRRLDGDYAVAVALAAKAANRPVKTVWTRADDMRFDCPRSPGAAAGLGRRRPYSRDGSSRRGRMANRRDGARVHGQRCERRFVRSVRDRRRGPLVHGWRPPRARLA